MTLSNLITKLQGIHKEHGDMLCYTDGKYGFEEEALIREDMIDWGYTYNAGDFSEEYSLHIGWHITPEVAEMYDETVLLTANKGDKE